MTDDGLTKAALIEQVAHVTGLTKKRTEIVIDTVFRQDRGDAAPGREGRTPRLRHAVGGEALA